MRMVINEEATKDELSRAQRQDSSLPTAPTALLTSEEDLDAKIFRIVKKVFDISTSSQSPQGGEESKIFVGGLNPLTTEEQSVGECFQKLWSSC